MRTKILCLYLAFISISLLSLSFSSYAQKPDEELTKEEALQMIQEYQSIVNNLQNTLSNLDSEIEKLKRELDQTNKNLRNCLDGYLGLLGINPETNAPYTNADIDKFRQKIGTIEGKIREMQRFSDDELADRRDQVSALEHSLNELRINKLSILPDFYDKIIKLASEIRSLYRERKVRTYVVGTWSENRDCLWNIAAKTEIYADPFLWSKIWQANTNIIKNPDIIFPGQQLLIPPPGPKTPDEIKAERRYWRQKKSAEEEKKGE